MQIKKCTSTTSTQMVEPSETSQQCNVSRTANKNNAHTPNYDSEKFKDNVQKVDTENWKKYVPKIDTEKWKQNIPKVDTESWKQYILKANTNSSKKHATKVDPEYWKSIEKYDPEKWKQYVKSVDTNKWKEYIPKYSTQSGGYSPNSGYCLTLPACKDFNLFNTAQITAPSGAKIHFKLPFPINEKGLKKIREHVKDAGGSLEIDN